MSDPDYLTESDDEFFEDFSGWEITDKDLDEILVEARKSNDIRLRRLVKHVQYLRFLMPKLVELAEKTDDTNTFVVLSQAALKSKINDRQS